MRPGGTHGGPQRFAWVTAMALLAASPLSGAANSAFTVSDSGAIAHATSVLETLHARVGAPGLAAAITIDGERVWEAYAGVSDLEAGTPVTAQTTFRVGSVSKAITAVSLARVWQAGGIDLDADVRRYVPSFPDKNAVITPRLLAGHLGGIRNYEQKDFAESTHIDHRHFATTADALTIFAEDPLVAAPGQRYRYSVFGYTLLAAVLEGASGRSFLSVLDSEVFAPLGLAHTGADSTDAAGRATAYERTSAGGASLSGPLDFSYKWAGGGLYSNVRDLTRLGSALLDSLFITPAALELLTIPQMTTDGRATEVGLGWRTGTDARGRSFIYHAGSISGGRAVVLVYPDHGVSVAITSNQALAPLMIESTAQVLVEPFLLRREGRHFDRARLSGRFVARWTTRNEEHEVTLEYGDEHDGISLHPTLNASTARLGSPVSNHAPVLPMLLSGTKAFIPVVTAAGAFGIDVSIGADDAMSGEVAGQYVRAAGSFEAVRLK